MTNIKLLIQAIIILSYTGIKSCDQHYITHSGINNYIFYKLYILYEYNHICTCQQHHSNNCNINNVRIITFIYLSEINIIQAGLSIVTFVFTIRDIFNLMDLYLAALAPFKHNFYILGFLYIHIYKPSYACSHTHIQHT